MARFTRQVRGVLFAAAACSLAATWLHSSAIAQEAAKQDSQAAVASEANLDQVAEAKVRQELDRPTSLEFIEEPLSNVMDFLADQHQMEVILHPSVENDAGVSPDAPVTIELKGLSLRSALTHLLDPLALTFVVRDGVLLIATPDAVGGMIEIQVYDVGDLIDGEDGVDLAMLLGTMFAPSSIAARRQFSPVGNPAATQAVASDAATNVRITPLPSTEHSLFVPYRNLLVVKASLVDHEALADVLAKMRAKLGAGAE